VNSLGPTKLSCTAAGCVPGSPLEMHPLDASQGYFSRLKESL